MKGGLKQQARIMAAVEDEMRGAFAHKLPPRDLENDATSLWLAADTLSMATPEEIAPHVTAIREAIEKAEFALAQVEL